MSEIAGALPWYWLLIGALALASLLLIAGLVVSVIRGPNVGAKPRASLWQWITKKECPGCNDHGYLIVPDGPGDHPRPVQKICGVCKGRRVY